MFNVDLVIDNKKPQFDSANAVQIKEKYLKAFAEKLKQAAGIRHGSTKGGYFFANGENTFIAFNIKRLAKSNIFIEIQKKYQSLYFLGNNKHGLSFLIKCDRLIKPEERLAVSIKIEQQIMTREGFTQDKDYRWGDIRSRWIKDKQFMIFDREYYHKSLCYINTGSLMLGRFGHNRTPYPVPEL